GTDRRGTPDRAGYSRAMDRPRSSRRIPMRGDHLTQPRNAVIRRALPLDSPLVRFVLAGVMGGRRRTERHGGDGLGNRLPGSMAAHPRSTGGGAELPVELTVTRAASDGPAAFTAHVRDISDRRRVEDERRRLLAAEQAARAEAEAAAELVRRVQTITDAALASLSLEELLRE